MQDRIDSVDLPLKCFVAMAFGHEDTNRLYDESLMPALAELGVTAVRVDRLEHNDNIDHRIVEEITSADFVLADLTYARPSVYYEAGFAEREIPVIYTIRRDHLAPRSDDPFGVFRLHFDLAMRNVIDWSEPGDPVFAARLRSRIDLVTDPIRARLREDSEAKELVRRFRAKSVEDRESLVQDAAWKALRTRGFVNKDGKGHESWRKAFENDHRRCFRFAEGTLEVVQMDFYRKGRTHWVGPDIFHEYNLNPHGCLSRTKRIREHWIVFATQPATAEEVCEGRTSIYQILTQDKELFRVETIQVPRVSRSFSGSVKLGWDYIPTPLGERLTKGRRRATGWFTYGEPPMGTISHEYVPGVAFVHGGFRWVNVTREIFIHVIDDIPSPQDAEDRLVQALAQPAPELTEKV